VPAPSGQAAAPPGQAPGEVPLPLITPPPAPKPSLAPGATVAPPVAGEWRGDDGRVSLVSPVRQSVTERSPWVVMIAVVLAVEVAVFWILACLGLWRRRIAAGGDAGDR
jgi:hypothetical protein